MTYVLPILFSLLLFPINAVHAQPSPTDAPIETTDLQALPEAAPVNYTVTEVDIPDDL